MQPNSIPMEVNERPGKKAVTVRKTLKKNYFSAEDWVPKGKK